MDKEQAEQLGYEDVVEYLGDREGDMVTISSFPTFGSKSIGTPRSTALGLTVTAYLGPIDSLPAGYTGDDRAALHLPILQENSEGGLGSYGVDDGLVLTREWFMAGRLSGSVSLLTIAVAADLDRPPLHPPVGQEPDPKEKRDVPLHEMIGWGFSFDFDGDRPRSGRWAEGRDAT